MKIAALALAAAMIGQPAVSDNDTVMKALLDEMARAPQLKVGPIPPPFFLQYKAVQTDEFRVRASLGSLTDSKETVVRELFPELHLGTPAFDNSNFVGRGVKSDGQRGDLPVDDVYAALRRSTWLLTDRAYKTAIQNLQTKMAWFQQNKVTDRLNDFQSEPAVVQMDECPPLKIDKSAWTQRIVELSKIFKNYPEIHWSRVELIAWRQKWWLVNTEGSRMRQSDIESCLTIWTNSQAPDGEYIGDSDAIYTTDPDKLPDQDTLKARVKTLAERVSALTRAPVGEDYVGPVMFEGQAAASLVSQVLAPNLGYPVEPLGMRDSNEDWRNPFIAARGHRVLVPFLSIIDDPLTKSFAGQDLRGGGPYDDEGVAAQRLNLVDHGILKMLCSSRTPTKWGDHSNGHSAMGVGWPTVLVVKSDKQMPLAQLKARLIQMGKDEGLDYVMIVRRLWNDYSLEEYSNLQTPSSSYQPSSPVEIYKVYVSDGHEELVRDLQFRYLTLRTFRDIDCTGDDTAAYPAQPANEPLKHVVTPSFLVNEVELERKRKENEDVPLLPSPLEKKDR